MTGSTAGGGAQLSSRSRKPTNNEPPKSGGADKISYADSLGDELTERTLFELAAFRDSLELGDGDPNFPQVGGIYGDVATVQGFERHHIPSNAVQDDSKNNLPIFLYPKRITLLLIAIVGSRDMFIIRFYRALLNKKVIVKR